MRNLLLWDLEELPPLYSGIVVLFRSFSNVQTSDVISIPEWIEQNADFLKQKYLSWVYELGESKIRGKRLIDHLELRTGFSYWWMTLIAEKCNFAKSPHIDDAIRLLAFEQWLGDSCFSHITLVSANAGLAECMSTFCRNMEMSFEWQHRRDVKEWIPTAKRLRQLLPYWFQSFAWLLIYLQKRWSKLKGVGLTEWSQSTGKITFISYLFNLAPNAVQQGHFESRYWGNLPDDLIKDEIKTNWLHIYIEDDVLPTIAKVADTIRRFNTKGDGIQIHVTLDSFLSLKVVYKTVRDAFRVWWWGNSIRPKAIGSKTTRFDLWPLYRKEWRQSFSGPVATNNLLNLNLFESATASLPKQHTGLYLLENQGWEFGMVHAWKAAKHGRLVGFAHSTVRYWDLRYFFSPQIYYEINQNRIPRPDWVAVNGSVARKAYLAGGYPECELLDVESLRYFHLRSNENIFDQKAYDSRSPLRILVMCDYVAGITARQLLLLQEASQYLPTDTIYIVKPHPAHPVDPADYPDLSIEITMQPIDQLLADCDVAYSSSVTSAAVDAYCVGVPVVSMLDATKLNLSPLRGCEDVVFASTPVGLAEALLNSLSRSRLKGKALEFFTLDTNLQRWRKVLQV